MMFNRMDTATLCRLGLVGLALHGGMRMLLERMGAANDGTDFALGLLIGASASLLLIVVWRRGRERRLRAARGDFR
jgi:uncharacterized membrane protein YccC